MAASNRISGTSHIGVQAGDRRRSVLCAFEPSLKAASRRRPNRAARAPALLLAVIAGTAQGSPMLQGLVDQLSMADYQGYVRSLEDFGTRYYNTPGNDAARHWLTDTFEDFGLDVRQAPYNHGGTTRWNVEATLTGLTNPDRILIVGAHFDSTSNEASVDAPGADDNATGVAALLEMASVFSAYELDSTVRFIAFNSEEQGLIGSQAYAASARARGDDIAAMINFDMIGYTAGDPAADLELMGDRWLVDSFVASATAYVTDLLVQPHYGDYYGSDHYYFHSNRYPGSASLMAIEDTPGEIWGGSNPHYHRTTDTSERLDWDFAYRVTQAGAATLAELAGITRQVSTPPAAWLLLAGLVALRLTSPRRRRDQGHATGPEAPPAR